MMPHADIEERRHYHREYGKRNREAARKRSSKWRERNPEQTVTHSRKYFLRTKFGLTLEDYDLMLNAQAGVCAICETDDTSPWGVFCVDHCHETGRVRGLLCHRCNVAIGQARDDPILLRRAADYLERP